MKTVVFIETNFSGLDALVYCKERGYRSVLITDNLNRFKKWFPPSCFYKLQAASEIIEVKNSNDFSEVKEVILARVGQVDAILSFAEIRTRIASVLCETFSLRGTPTSAIDLAQNKSKFRARLKEAQVDFVNCDLFNTASDLEEHFLKDGNPIRFPCFIKPCEGHSSIGAYICRDLREAKQVIGKIKNLKSEGISSSYLVEDFLQGPLTSVEVLTVGPGVHQVLGIADRDIVGFGVEVGSSFPVKPREADAIVGLAKQALDTIGYSFGPSHIEMILTDTGPHLVELNTRVGGSGHSVMLDAALGRSVVGDCIELCLGTHNLDPNLYESKRGAAWQCYTSARGGVLKSLPKESDILASDGTRQVWIHKQIGAQLEDLESNFNWIFQVLCVGQDADDARTKAQQAIQLAASKVFIEESITR